jgi:large subunit ribosomal protein L25
VLTQVTNTVNVEALPLEIPEHLELDVSELGIGESARLAQVKLPEGVTVLDDPEETVLASVALPRAEEPEPGEGEEGAEAAEGAEAPEAEAAETDAATGDGEAAETTEG